MNTEKASCIVTGASRGLGRAVAVELARRGRRVCVNFRSNAQAAAQTVDAVRAANGEAFAHRADVRDATAVAAMIETLCDRWGPPGLLVNNAGIARNCLLAKMSEGEWDEVVATNFRGTLNCCRAAAPVMAAAGGGQIINIASVSGLRGREGQSHYAAAKGAVVGLTLSLAAELAPAGVCVNAVVPGYLPTEMGLAFPGAAEAARRAHLLGRLSDVEETARFIADLAETQTVTGQVLSVDGRL